MKRMRKVLSIVLCIVMLISTINLTSFAENTDANVVSFPTTTQEEFNAYSESTLMAKSGTKDALAYSNGVKAGKDTDTDIALLGADKWNVSSVIKNAQNANSAVSALTFLHSADRGVVDAYYKYATNVKAIPDSVEFYYTRHINLTTNPNSTQVKKEFLDIIYGISPTTTTDIPSTEDATIVIGQKHVTTLYLVGFNVAQDTANGYVLLTRVLTRTVTECVYNNGTGSTVEVQSNEDKTGCTVYPFSELGLSDTNETNPNNTLYANSAIDIAKLLKVKMVYDDSNSATKLTPNFSITGQFTATDADQNLSNSKQFSLTFSTEQDVIGGTKKAVGIYATHPLYTSWNTGGAFANPVVSYTVTCSECTYDNACDAECNNCGSERGSAHHVVKKEAAEATSYKSGNIEYWYCDAINGCGKYYSDELGTQEIEDKTRVIIPATGWDASNGKEVKYLTSESDLSTWLENNSEQMLYIDSVATHQYGKSGLKDATADDLTNLGANAWNVTAALKNQMERNMHYTIPTFLYTTDKANIDYYYQYANKVTVEPISAELFYTRSASDVIESMNNYIRASFMELIYGISKPTSLPIYAEDGTTEIGKTYTTTLYTVGFNLVQVEGVTKLAYRYRTFDVIDTIYNSEEFGTNSSTHTPTNVNVISVAELNDLNFTGDNPNAETQEVTLARLMKVKMTYGEASDGALNPKFEIQGKYSIDESSTFKTFTITLDGKQKVTNGTKKAVGIYAAQGAVTHNYLKGAFADPVITYEASQFEKQYADLLSSDVSRLSPYDVKEIDKMLSDYEALGEMAPEIVGEAVVTIMATLQEAAKEWNITSDATIAESYRSIWKGSEDTEGAWNVYQRLTAKQKGMLTEEYTSLVEKMQAETQVSGKIAVGWAGDTIPEGFAEQLGDDYRVSIFDDNISYDMIIVAKGTSESEIHSYLRNENTPLVVVTTHAASQAEAETNMNVATKYGLPCIDIYAYENGGGTDTLDTYTRAIMSLANLFTTETVKGFSFDDATMNSFLSPELFSATIKNEASPANQGLGFKTNISEYKKTGAKMTSYGTIFARYSSKQSYDDMVLENVGNGKYFNADIKVQDDGGLHGSSYIAGINLRNNEDFSRVYVARSYVKYADGSVYYSINTRTDLESSLKTRKGVVDGYACRSLTGVAKNMVLALAEQGCDISGVGTSVSGVLKLHNSAADNDAKAIFELIFANQTILEGIQNTVYISNAGSDENVGTENSPYLTLGKALDKVPNGGRIYVKNGEKISVSSNFVWEQNGKKVTITSNKDVMGELDFSALSEIVLGNDVTFDAVSLTFTDNSTLYANGNKLVVEDSVDMTNIINVYGGGKQGTTVTGTDVTLRAGSYYRVYGGSKKGVVAGDTKLCIGGSVNTGLNAAAHESSNYRIYAGGNDDTISGDTSCIFEGNASTNQLFGGSYGQNAVIDGTANLTFSGGSVYAICGGNDTSEHIKGTKVTILGGTIAQVFGANQNACMTGDVELQILGGTITRRVYGGCYNGYTHSGYISPTITWATPANYVTGNIRLTLSGNAKITFADTSDGDVSLYACSRYGTDFAEEVCTVVFADATAYNNYYKELGANNDTLAYSIQAAAMKNVSPYDSYEQPYLNE